MLYRWEKLEKNRVKLEIEVASPDVDTALARSYRKVVKEVNLPGFRKGKVPRRILESRFGPEILHEEALELLVPPAYQEALDEVELDVIGRPDFELVQIEEGKPLLFNAVIEVIPDIELGSYRGLEAEQEEVVVDDIQVDHHIYMLREQNARLVPREEGPVKEGDHVLISFKGLIDGEPFEGGEADSYPLEIGSKAFIPGFEEQLVGVELGSETEVNVKFPENYRQKDFAGKEALFRVTVKQIKEKKLPDLDDQFVREISEFETVEEMKADLREKLLKNAEDQSKSKLEESLIEKVSENAVLELPVTLVERQIDRMIGELDSYLQYQGMNIDQFYELSKTKKEDLREERRVEAEKRTRANLVLDAVAKKEGIDVEESEVETKIASIAETYNDQPERLRDLLEKQGRLPVIREELRIRKVIDLIAADARITMVKKKEGQASGVKLEADEAGENSAGGAPTPDPEVSGKNDQPEAQDQGK